MLELSLGDNGELLTRSFVDYFEEEIKDTDTIIEFKINKINPTLEDDVHDVLDCVKNYVMFGIGAKIKFSTCGMHQHGKKLIPHFHYHFVCERCIKPQNPSDHRKRYTKKMRKDDEWWDLGDISMKWHDKPLKDKPKYHILAYPFKEGNYCKYKQKIHQIDRGTPMKQDKIDFLVSVGKTIYQNALASNHRNDLCEERKKNKLLELYDIVKDQKFSNFKEMMVWLDENYILLMALEQMPDFRNYKSNCEKVGVKIGILKYSQLY